MKDGFITVATATPQVAVADCEANTQAILACINEMAAAHAKIMVLPELCITGLYLQRFVLADEIARRGRGGAFRYCGRITPGGCPYRSRNAPSRGGEAAERCCHTVPGEGIGLRSQGELACI